MSSKNKFKEIFLVVKTNDEKIFKDCESCNGKGKKKGKIFDDFLDKEFDIDYDCPVCNGQGKIDTGELMEHKILKVLEFGRAELVDLDGKEATYILGTRASREEFSEFIELNGASSILLYPQLIDWFFLGKNQKVFDTLEDAEAELKNMKKD